MSQEQAAAAVNVAITSDKNRQRKTRKKKERPVRNWGFKEGKNVGFYETLLAELGLEEEYSYKKYLWMTSKNFAEISQLMRGDIT